MKSNKKLAIDTNMLFLAVCVSLNLDPSTHKRLSAFNTEDIFITDSILKKFELMITTPNILTEFSNLSKDYREKCWLKDFINNGIEIYIPSRKILEYENPYFERLGLTDLCFVMEELNDCTVLTDDKTLVELLFSRGKEVIFYSGYRNHYIEQ